MDFGSLLYAAHKNEKTANKDIKCYKTKFEPPKKEVKSKTNLSANIQKYLQKRDEEEKKKTEEEKRKKEELLVLRSQDKKAYKRVQTMLKRTKSANKSVMEDAIDDVNTAVTMAGPQQCDEDDYGYVSQEASAFYAKLMDKYSSLPPEEPKFPQGKKPVVKDLNAAKDRVRAALQREEEEEMMPHKRKRKSKSDKLAEENDEQETDEYRRISREPSPVEDPKPKKPKKSAPPPIDFSSLLKLAEKKQFEPIKIEKKVKDDTEERPMTKKEKLEYERQREWRERKLERENATKVGQRKPDSLNKIPKISSNAERNEKSNGLSRIPKKSNLVENKPKPDNYNEGLKRKDSFDSDSANRPNSDNDRSRNNIRSHNDRPRNNLQPDNEYPRNKHQLESNHRIDTSKKDYYEKRSMKPSQTSVKSRTHNISDDEQSGASDSGPERERSRDYKTDRPQHSIPRPPKDTSRSYSERNSFNRRHLNNTNNELSDSPSGSDSKKYYSTKGHSPTITTYKHKPEVKYKSENDRSFSQAKLTKRSPSRERSVETSRDRSHSPDNSKFNEKRKRSHSDSEPDEEDRYKPSKKPIHSLNKEKSKRYSYREHSVESDCERSHSTDNTRYQQSYSDSDPEEVNKYKPSKKHVVSPNKDLPKRPYRETTLDSDHEQSTFSNNIRTNSKRRQSFSESEQEEENKPSKRHVTSLNKGTYKRPSHYEQSVESDCNQSKYGKKRRQSYSDSEQEDRKIFEPPKKQSTSMNKEKKISSLFEGSDDEVSSKYKNTHIRKEVENKKPKFSNESERQKSGAVEARFKIPTTNFKPDSNRNKVSDNSEKYRSSENMKSLSSSISKTQINKEENKKILKSSNVRTCTSDRSYSSTKPVVDKIRSATDKSKEKSYATNETSKTENSPERGKKPIYQSAEEALKKSANVWSKPCNMSPSPSTKPLNSGLSESQIQRLREMNKKPTPSKPVDNRFRPVLSENKISSVNKPSPKDEKKSEGRPLLSKPGGVLSPRPSGSLQGKPSLLKAAAAAAASRAASQRPQVSSISKGSESLPKTFEKQQSPRISEERQPSKNLDRHPPASSSTRSREVAAKDTGRKQFPPNDLRPRQFPPNDLKSRPLPPSDVRGRQFPPPDVRRKPNPRRIIEDDSEEDYDSEMDDFIDDGSDMNQEQISKEIQSIFGYDKSRYVGFEEDDDECMESNFGQIDIEEDRSLRIAAREDYEELMKEMAEKKRKAKRKKEMMAR